MSSEVRGKPDSSNGPGQTPVQRHAAASTHATIIIPSWNGRELLSRCLPALSAQTHQDFEVVIVDNGSTDGSVRWVMETHPGVQIVALEQNLGFASACNAGIRATEGELIITLNNDTIPQPDWLAELLYAAERNPAIGMFGTKLCLHTEPAVIDAVGLEIDRLGVAWNIGNGLLADQYWVPPQRVFGPCAGAALYRRRLLQDVGLFEESYFAYLEDAELAWRARWAGWEAMAVPRATVWHIHSATGGRDPTRKYWLLGRNRLWTILRHYPRPYLWYYLPLILLNEMFTGLLGTLALRNPAPIKGRLYALRNWRSAIFCSAPRRLSSAEAFAQLAPLPSLSDLKTRYPPRNHETSDNSP